MVWLGQTSPEFKRNLISAWERDSEAPKYNSDSYTFRQEQIHLVKSGYPFRCYIHLQKSLLWESDTNAPYTKNIVVFSSHLNCRGVPYPSCFMNHYNLIFRMWQNSHKIYSMLHSHTTQRILYHFTIIMGRLFSNRQFSELLIWAIAVNNTAWITAPSLPFGISL